MEWESSFESSGDQPMEPVDSQSVTGASSGSTVMLQNADVQLNSSDSSCKVEAPKSIDDRLKGQLEKCPSDDLISSQLKRQVSMDEYLSSEGTSVTLCRSSSSVSSSDRQCQKNVKPRRSYESKGPFQSSPTPALDLPRHKRKQGYCPSNRSWSSSVLPLPDEPQDRVLIQFDIGSSPNDTSSDQPAALDATTTRCEEGRKDGSSFSLSSSTVSESEESQKTQTAMTDSGSHGSLDALDLGPESQDQPATPSNSSEEMSALPVMSSSGSSNNVSNCTSSTSFHSYPNSAAASGRKKKSSWYNALYPTYKSRSEDFKKIFSDLPPQERLIVEYSCALQKDILVHGRLYITKNYVCFYANFFRWETSVALPWREVIGVTKEKTALVIPNAIQISTDNEKHFFTSFAARDKAFMMLFKLWQNALLDQHASSAEIWQWVHSVYGDELGLTSDDEVDYVSPFGISVCPSTSVIQTTPNESLKMMSKSLTSPASLNEPANDSRFCSSSAVKDRSLCSIEESGGSRPDDGKRKNNDSGGGGVLVSPPNGRSRPSFMALDSSRSTRPSSDSSDMSSDQSDDNEKAFLSKDGGTKNKTVSNTSTNNNDDLQRNIQLSKVAFTVDTWRQSNHDGRELTSENYPVDVDTLFTLLFTNSKFYMDFHSSRKTFDMVQSAWQQKEDGSDDKIREVAFTLTLTHPMGPKHSQVTETQVMTNDSIPGQIYIIDVETINSGIPYADSFYVISHFCLSRVSDRQSNLTVFSEIKYRKTVWGLVKTFIEKNTWAGLEDFYTNLSRALQVIATDMSRGTRLRIRKGKKSSKCDDDGRGNELCKDDMGEDKANSETSPSRSKRSKFSVGSQNVNTGPSESYGSAIGHSSEKGSSFQFILVMIIIVLLLILLLTNSLLFYRLYNLESNALMISQYDQQRLMQDLDSGFLSGSKNAFAKKLPQNDEEWLRLLQRQESLHQMELDKWQELLDSAVKLLRQSEDSLSNLQRAIRPLALKKLRRQQTALPQWEPHARAFPDQAENIHPPKQKQPFPDKEADSPSQTTSADVNMDKEL